MSTLEPSTPEHRGALIRAAQRLTAEAGPEAGAMLDPDLAGALAVGLAEDVAAAIERRTAGAETLDELVGGLVDAVLEASVPWADGLQLANVAVERVTDFEHWNGMLAPWLDAVEGAIAAGQEQGIVRDDVEPRATALVLRDAIDRAAKVQIRFQRDGYRDATVALVRGALAPAGADAVTE